MSKEAIIQRMYPQPNRDAVSFAIRQGVQSHLLDAPFAPDPLIPPEESNGIFYTHFHKDHCPQKGESVNVETFFSPTTLVLLRHIGVDTNQFRRSEPLKSSQWNGVDGLGRIYPIPVSHSSVDAQAFFLALESGGTIFYSGDIRSGYRTDRAIAEVKNLVGSSGASLFIGDATRIGKNHITVAEHVERLKQSLRLAEKNNAGTAVFVKAGDYGNIALWFENRVFENCRVFLHPKLERVLGEKGLNWFPFLYQRYGYRPPDISEMDDLLRRRNKGVVFLYDDCWENRVRQHNYVLVNASRREIPYKSDNVIAVFPIGFSGHSGDAFNQFLQACHPEYVAFSHAPKKGCPNLGNAKLVLKKTKDELTLS